MLNWFRSTPNSPLSADQRTWVEQRFLWLRDNLGVDRMTQAEIILPTTEFFPDSYSATYEEILHIVDLVAGYMGVESEKLDVGFYDEYQPAVDGAENNWSSGLYHEAEGRFQIWLETSSLEDPLRVCATVTHEIGHVVLLGQRLVEPTEDDHELLTDLLSVYLGLGIITANNVILESNWTTGRWSGWSVASSGYMSMEMYGYALAIYAIARGEPSPDWAKYLRLDVRSPLKQSVRFITETDECHYPFQR